MELIGTKMALRKSGSVRFDPYYKVQWYDARSLAWMDVQRAHPTAAEARGAFLKGRTCRIMEVTPSSRSVLPAMG